MHTLRPIQFVDGENLVMRYQAMIAAGRKPVENVKHKRDVYVWHEGLASFFNHGFARIYYYTTVVGAEPEVEKVKAEIASCKYMYIPSSTAVMSQLVPFVFKKASQSQKTRNVDIQLVIDVMRFASTESFNLLFIASGDGDYLPLIVEAMRSGKQVVVAAFSSGLNPLLPNCVDKFIDLDELFFLPENAG